MITHDMSFVRAESVEDLVAAWQEASHDGADVRWFGGGTEIVTLERDGKQHNDVLIDYKRVPDAVRAGREGERLVLGAGLRLNMIYDRWPGSLLARTIAGVADRTVRNSITLGGNICGMLPYREAVLPFLLLDGEVEVLSGKTGAREWRSLGEVFRKRLVLEPDELVLAWAVAAEHESFLLGGATERRPAGGQGSRSSDGTRAYGAVEAMSANSASPWYCRRRTRDPRLDYPVVTLALARVSGDVRVAVSGTWGFPVRATRCEAQLSAIQTGVTDPQTVRAACEAAIDAEAFAVKEDMRASRVYRRELTVQALTDGLMQLNAMEQTQ